MCVCVCMYMYMCVCMRGTKQGRTSPYLHDIGGNALGRWVGVSFWYVSNFQYDSYR